MNKGLLIGFGIVLAVILSYPFVMQMSANQGGGARPAATGSAPTAGQSAPAPAPAAAPQPPLLNAQNLVGTAWNVQGFTVELQSGGVAQAAGTPLGTIRGTWSVSGSTFTVQAMGRTVTAQISGDQILHDGKPIARVR